MSFRHFYHEFYRTFAENWDLFVWFHSTKKYITILRRFTKSLSAFIASLLWFFNSWEINTIHFIDIYEPFYENRTVFATIVSSTKLILEIDLITIPHQGLCSKQLSQQNNQNKIENSEKWRSKEFCCRINFHRTYILQRKCVSNFT